METGEAALSGPVVRAALGLRSRGWTREGGAAGGIVSAREGSCLSRWIPVRSSGGRWSASSRSMTDGWHGAGRWLAWSRSMVGIEQVDGWHRAGRWLASSGSMVGIEQVDGRHGAGRWSASSRSMVGIEHIDGWHRPRRRPASSIERRHVPSESTINRSTECIAGPPQTCAHVASTRPAQRQAATDLHGIAFGTSRLRRDVPAIPRRPLSLALGGVERAPRRVVSRCSIASLQHHG